MSAFSIFLREYLDLVIIADQCAQNVEANVITGNDVDHLIKNLRATIESITKAGLKLTLPNAVLAHLKSIFLEGQSPQKMSIPKRKKSINFLEKTKLPKSRRPYSVGFVNYNRNLIPRLFEKSIPFFQLPKKDQNVLVTTELVQHFNGINQTLTRAAS